eukprot:Opistho-1_new@98642
MSAAVSNVPREARRASRPLQPIPAGYRVAFDNLKGQRSITPVAFVSPVRVGCALQKGRVFVEHIPGHLADVVVKAVEQATKLGCQKNDAGGYQTLDDAIVHAQAVCARLVLHVEPQNLFLVFVQPSQAVRDFPFRLEPVPPSFYDDLQCAEAAEHQDATAKDKNQPHVLCVDT